MSCVYANKVLTEKEWSLILNFLIYPQQLEISFSILFFLEKNNFFYQADIKDIYSGALESLTGGDLLAVEEKILWNFMTFLKLPEITKKYLVLNCLNLKSYTPLRLYLKNCLLTSNFENKPNKDKKYIKYFLKGLGFYVLILIIIRTFYGNSTRQRILLETESCYAPWGFQDMRAIRGGFDEELGSNAQDLCCNIEYDIESLSLVDRNELEEAKKIAEEIKNNLISPQYSFKNSNNKTVNLSYKSRFKPTGPFEVNVTLIDVPTKTFSVSFYGDVSYYEDYQQDSTLFLKRVNHLNSEFRKNYIQCTINIPKTMTFYDSKNEPLTVSLQHQGDHIEGIKSHRATGRDKKQTLIVVKPEYIHAQQTEFRKKIEQNRVFTVIIDPKTNESLQVKNNKTYLAKGHDINTYFDFCRRDAAEVRSCLDPNRFPVDFSIDKLATSEERAFKIQQAEFLQLGREKGLDPVAQLVDFKCNAGSLNCSNDLSRVKRDIFQKFHYCQQPNVGMEFVQDKAQELVGKVLKHSRDVKIYIESSLKLFGENRPELKEVLMGLLKTKKAEIRGLRVVVEDCGIEISPILEEDFQSFEIYSFDHPKELLAPGPLSIREKTDGMTPKKLDQLGALLEIDSVKSDRRGVYLVSKNYLAQLTRKSTTNFSTLQPGVPLGSSLDASTFCPPGFEPPPEFYL